MTRLHVSGPMLLRAVTCATANLERHVEEVDALNVFPVPDGDTGSNMLATMRAALAEAEALPQGQRDLDSVAEALSRGALRGARGNSGVILSQIIRGMTERADGRRRADGVDLAYGLRIGSDVAYGSVLSPVEGTILTVIRDAADAAETAAGRQPHVEAVLADVIEAAASSVQRTPTLLPLLQEAGVVDSGGQGLFRVLEGMLHVGVPLTSLRVAPRLTGAVVLNGSNDDPHHGHRLPHLVEGDDHGYETQYLLASPEGRIDVAALRDAVVAVGDSVVVAGDEWSARVHVHGDRPDLAIGAGLPFGRLSRVEIHDLDAQVAHHAVPPADRRATSGTVAPIARDKTSTPEPAPVVTGIDVPGAATIAMVACASAPGLADILASLGAVVVRPAEGIRPSVGEIAAAVMGCGAPDVIVLPNDRDALLAARLAASLTSPVRVTVVGSRNAAEGIAAALAFDARQALDDNAHRMRTEAAALLTFTVTTAARDAVVEGRPVRQGDVIALDASRHLLATGDDVASVTLTALGGYPEIELVTLYLGEGADPGLADVLRQRMAEAGLDVEIEAVPGGQPHDRLLVAVE